MRRFRVWWLPIEVAFRADARRAIAVPALAVVAGLGGILHALGLKWLVDGVSAGAAEATVAAALVLAGMITFVHLIGTAGARVRMAFQQKVAFELDRRVLQMCTRVPEIAHYEDPGYLDRIEVLRETRGELGTTYGQLLQGLRGAVQMCGILALLAALDPRLLLLPAFAVPAALATARGERVLQEAEEAVAPDARAHHALVTLATSAAAGKELRIYGLARELAARCERLVLSVQGRRRGAERTAALWTATGRLAFTAGFLGALTLAATGRAGAGDVALVLVLAGQLDGTAGTLIGLYSSLRRSAHAARHYFWLAGYSPAGPSSPAVPLPLTSGGEIALDHVSFRYPGAANPVLRDVSLRLTSGSVVAVVGENGAGKSSLVKLLCGLYHPTEGTIRYGGAGITAYGLAAWQERLSAGFQDFCRLELVTRASVGVGDLPRADDEPAVLAALADAGAERLVGDLPAGLATQLGTSFENGVELSGGQWQWIALGRAAMRAEPILRVLDEPTSGLAPEAEHALFTRYAALARRPGHRTITVMVSHRFSTVRMADVIVVLDAGRLVELGDHATLMAAGGRYAELYRLQARGYR
ncbi:ABC transporter ATP-binding protein [Nonomuraea sp. NPDC050394]|uniref:ABC transporter ATP-binding protein n=1 Tax=Nonomuraea sp. NPDC050394 TaxID=3364363 RepID=UPI0037B9F785